MKPYKKLLCATLRLKAWALQLPTATFLELDEHGHKPRIAMAGNSLHDPEFYSSSEVLYWRKVVPRIASAQRFLGS